MCLPCYCNEGAPGSHRKLRRNTVAKAIIDQVGLTDEVGLRVEEQHLVNVPATAPRTGWSEALQALGTEPANNSILRLRHALTRPNGVGEGSPLEREARRKCENTLPAGRAAVGKH
jgi:hypothetical protein